MDTTEREKRTTDHPVAYTVTNEQPLSDSADVAKRMGMIAAISAGIALLIRRTLYPKMLEMQPENLPVALPSDFGFFASGWGIAAGALYAKRNSPSTRRSFFYTLAAGLGAVIGAKLGGAMEGATSGVMDGAKDVVAGSIEQGNDTNPARELDAGE